MNLQIATQLIIMFCYPVNKFDKFATTSGNFEEIKYSDMQHRKTYNYFNFQQNWSADQSKPCTQMYLQKS